MDMLENNTIEDIRNSTNKMHFNNSKMSLDRSIAGRGLCLTITSIQRIIEILPTTNGSIPFTSFWIKHGCVVSQRVVILTTPLFIFYCDERNSYAAIAYKKDYYLSSTSLGFGIWYHTGIGIKDGVVSIYINGIKIYLSKTHRKIKEINATTYQGIFIHNTDGITCLDELLLSSTPKSHAEVMDIYQAYIPGNDIVKYINM